MCTTYTHMTSVGCRPIIAYSNQKPVSVVHLISEDLEIDD